MILRLAVVHGKRPIKYTAAGQSCHARDAVVHGKRPIKYTKNF